MTSPLEKKPQEEEKLYWKKLSQIQRENANNIYQEYPLNTRVKLKEKERLGTVVLKPSNEIVCYAGHHVPVKWDGQNFVSQVSKHNLEIVSG